MATYRYLDEAHTAVVDEQGMGLAVHPPRELRDDPRVLAFQAWLAEGNEPDEYMPDPAKAISERANEIVAKLSELDRKSIRPNRAVSAGRASEADVVMLDDIETRAEALRKELAELTAELPEEQS